MLIVFLVLCAALVVGGAFLVRSYYSKSFGNDGELCGGIAMIIIGGLLLLAVIIVMCYQTSRLVETFAIDEKIAMYEEENAVIESQIEMAVKQYQEYEGGIITEIGSKESYITLVSLYPELKADELVNKQIEVYMNNNRTIVELRNQKINERIYRWWLYFGG